MRKFIVFLCSICMILSINCNVFGEQSLEKEKIQRLLNEYFTEKYEALTKLEAVDYAKYYHEDLGEESRKLNENITDLVTEYRKDAKEKTALESYSFEIIIENIEKDENEYDVKVSEKFKYKYKIAKEETEGITEHEFKLIKEESGNLKIKEHDNKDRFIENIKSKLQNSKDYRGTEEEVKQSILDEAREKREKLKKEMKDVKEEEKKTSSTEDNSSDFVSYNRAEAVKYAKTWAMSRNKRFNNFEGTGGDCTNFTSQCINAGGIIMDLENPHIWKYFSSDWNDSASRNGRSASWTSVMNFRNYVIKNTEGIGLRANLTEDLSGLDKGDIVQIENEHGVVIVDVIYDEEKVPMDFLIACHSSDRLNESLILEWPNYAFDKVGIKIKGSYR